MSETAISTKEEICQFLTLIHSPGQVFEIRAFSKDGAIYSGYFDNPAITAGGVVCE